MRGEEGENEVGDVKDDNLQVWDALMKRIVANETYVEMFAKVYPRSNPRISVSSTQPTRLLHTRLQRLHGWTRPSTDFLWRRHGDDRRSVTRGRIVLR